MSFDIYGNNLARGHCEVHPHVAEEYPCSLCMAESNRKEDFNASQELEYHLGQCQERIEELETKIKKLEQAQPKWISVDDELPEANFTFLAIMNHGAVYTMRLPVLLSKNKLTETSRFTREHVTHWMPLPEQPEVKR